MKTNDATKRHPRPGSESRAPARRRPSRSWGRLALVIALTLFAAACGNKGDLYLPDESPPPAES